MPSLPPFFALALRFALDNDPCRPEPRRRPRAGMPKEARRRSVVDVRAVGHCDGGLLAAPVRTASTATTGRAVCRVRTVPVAGEA